MDFVNSSAIYSHFFQLMTFSLEYHKMLEFSYTSSKSYHSSVSSGITEYKHMCMYNLINWMCNISTTVQLFKYELLSF